MIGRRTASPIAYSAPIVSKAMRVLKFIISSPDNPGISEIAATLSLAKSTTHGILAALEESGWVLRDPVTRRYTAGYAVKEVASQAEVRVPLVGQARPFLEELSRELDDDIFLGVFAGYRILILDQIESSKELKITAKPGTRISMYAGASGKMFLAYMDKEAQRKILQRYPLPQFTSHSITDPEKYLAELNRVRKAGIAFDSEEYIPNVKAIAVPIFYGKKTRRRMVGGFWLVGLDWHLTPGKIKIIERLALKTGEALSRAISKNYGEPK